ncbi:response regulator transcription factor [Arenimonas sp.]|nr:response regulator transcription factor [Candidatus Parcubacteria bacterium]
MKILLIEDDQILSDILRKNLENNGFSVDQFFNGKDAQKHIQLNKGGYDLMILDLIIPFIEGDEICKNARSLGIDVPILILTGKDSIEDKIRILNSGADDYITKPFSTGELIARIHALLRRPKIAVENEIKIGSIILNLQNRIIKKNGRLIELTLKEFGIFEYLVRNANKIVLRDQILDHVWDNDFSSSSLSNIIDIYICRIRKKLGLKAPHRLETVRGVGYRLKI